jgi:hypothetical protein
LQGTLIEARASQDHALGAQALEGLLALHSHRHDTTLMLVNYEELSWHLLETHQFLRAIKVARKASEIDPSRLGVQKNLAIAYFMNQQFRHGEELISNIHHHSLHGQPMREVFLKELHSIAVRDSALLPIVERASTFVKHIPAK